MRSAIKVFGVCVCVSLHQLQFISVQCRTNKEHFVNVKTVQDMRIGMSIFLHLNKMWNALGWISLDFVHIIQYFQMILLIKDSYHKCQKIRKDEKILAKGRHLTYRKDLMRSKWQSTNCLYKIYAQIDSTLIRATNYSYMFPKFVVNEWD